MPKKTHIVSWKKSYEGGSGATVALCGAKRVRAVAVLSSAVAFASNQNDATCWRCRTIRDGR